MRSRAIKDLARLNDKDLFIEIAEGLSAVQDNSSRIADAFKIIAKRENARGARILEAIAKEEAAKYLILLDAIRCPRMPADRFSKHLAKYNEHLAKGLYADACNWRPASFGEIKSIIEEECKQYYLDGPNDVDWIFENSIIRKREEAFYVDYIESDETHIWLSPARYDSPSSVFCGVPSVVELMNQLHTVGFSKAKSLELISDMWRPITFTDGTDFSQLRDLNCKTLEVLSDAGLLIEAESEIYSHIAYVWLFPLYDLEMRQTQMKQSKLKEIQDRWYPEC